AFLAVQQSREAMRAFRNLMLLALVLLPGRLLAQDASPGKVSVGTKIELGKKPLPYKGWYLYWPMEALKQPRQPMPYPWWPSQNAGIPSPVPSNPPPTNSGAPGAPHVPNDTQGLPPLPTSTS